MKPMSSVAIRIAALRRVQCSAFTSRALGPRAQAVTDCDAAHHEMHMRVVGVPMGDANPVQPGAEIALHLADQVAGEGPRVSHLGGILRRDDETEMMPVALAASREGHGVGAVLGGAVLATERGTNTLSTFGSVAVRGTV
jgi:hypothetical protein